MSVSAAEVVREIRRRAGIGLRELARRATTSHATLHSYERGSKEPRLETLARLADAAGFALEVTLAPRPDAGAARMAKGRELVEVLRLASVFPARHAPRLRAPVFPRASR
jgi:transcriptional regulator with XRE-family HTH domain